MLRAELRTKQVAAELNHEPVKTGLVWYRDLVVQSPPCKGLNRQAYRYLRVSESIFNRGVGGASQSASSPYLSVNFKMSISV